MLTTLKVINFDEKYAVVCVPKTLSINGIEELMNQVAPLMGQCYWKVSEQQFADGSKNPSPCPDQYMHGKNRLHYLMVNNVLSITKFLEGGCNIECEN